MWIKITFYEFPDLKWKQPKNRNIWHILTINSPSLNDNPLSINKNLALIIFNMHQWAITIISMSTRRAAALRVLFIGENNLLMNNIKLRITVLIRTVILCRYHKKWPQRWSLKRSYWKRNVILFSYLEAAKQNAILSRPPEYYDLKN